MTGKERKMDGERARDGVAAGLKADGVVTAIRVPIDKAKAGPRAKWGRLSSLVPRLAQIR